MFKPLACRVTVWPEHKVDAPVMEIVGFGCTLTVIANLGPSVGKQVFVLPAT